jgi:hypothetical protein
MYGLTRRDQNNNTRIGITGLALLFIILFCATFFILSRRNSAPKAARSTPGVARTAQSSQALSSWQDVELPSGLEERLDVETAPTRRTTPKPTQGVLEMDSLRMVNLSQDMSEFEPTLQENGGAFEALLNRTKVGSGNGVRLEVADDGNEYLRAGTGIYTAFAQPGARLKGPKDTDYIINKDGLLAEISGSSTNAVTKFIAGRFRDLAFRFYFIDRDTSQLMLHTPGGPGMFRGPTAASYRIKENGDMVEIDAEGAEADVERVAGAGEFQGTDTNIYLVMDGMLFAPATDEVTFAASNITGEGMFRGPQGDIFYKGADGLLYNYDENNALVLGNLTGTGQFKGPDGSLYQADGDGNVTQVQPAVAPALMDTPVSKPVTVGTSRGLSGTAQTDNNLLNFNTDEDFTPESAASDLASGSVYRMGKEEREEMVATPEPIVASKAPKFLPRGAKIPFYLLTTLTNEFPTPGTVEAVVAENVFFHGSYLEAGTRMYGSVEWDDEAKGHRMTIIFDVLVNTDGSELKLAGSDVFDVSMTFGMEAYFKPTPLWVYGLNYANIGIVYALQENQPEDADGRPMGNMDGIFEKMEETTSDITRNYQGYHILPRGTAGVMMLKQRLNLNWTSGQILAVDETAQRILGEDADVYATATSAVRQIAQPLDSSVVNGILEQSRTAMNTPGGAAAYAEMGGSSARDAKTVNDLENLFGN